MKHVIIAAHPNAQSLTLAMAHGFADALKQNGHEANLRDLYALSFNPVLSEGELAGESTVHDVHVEQEFIADADAVSFVYPLWWASMPAILKGYIDRVFAYGFAYEHEGQRLRGLLQGKKSVIITLSAAPRATMEQTGDWGAIRALQDGHIFRACDLDVVHHAHFDAILPGMTEPDVADRLAAVRDLAARYFGKSG